MINPHDIVNKTFDAYNRNEKLAIEDFPNNVLSVFSPNHFLVSNFSVQLTKPLDVWKYFDSMHENKIGQHFSQDLGGYLEEQEMVLIENVAKKYSEYVKSFNRKTTPIGISGMISSISTLRILKIKKTQWGITRPLRVLEVGPGSGMLGLLLSENTGINHTMFDVTNAFAIHICSLYNFLFGKDFRDLSYVPHINYKSKEVLDLINDSSKITFLPWWHFLNTNLSLPKYDVIIMNHCFFEIQRKALLFILKRLGSSSERQLIISSYWGSNEVNKYDNEDIKKLEKRFDIREERIVSKKTGVHKNIYIPRTMNLYSYKFLPSNNDISFFHKNIESRLGYDLIKESKIFFNFKDILKKIVPKYFHSYLRYFFRFFKSNKFYTPIIIGVHKLNNPNINNIQEDIFPKVDFEEFKLRIKNIESINGLASFTEDDLFGYYIGSKED